MSDLDAILPPAPGVSLVDGVQQAVRDAIFRGALAPGFRLREVPLSEHFGCSTTPVREALRRLEDEGIVVVHPRRGAEVVSIPVDTLNDLYETRLLLEVHAVHRAVERDTAEEDLAELRLLLDRAEPLLGTADLALLNTMDIQFHKALARLSGNGVVAELIERVTRQILVVRVRTDARVTGGPATAHEHHSKILDAIKAGDGPLAERWIRDHILWSAEAVMASVRGEQTEAG